MKWLLKYGVTWNASNSAFWNFMIQNKHVMLFVYNITRDLYIQELILDEELIHTGPADKNHTVCLSVCLSGFYSE